MLIAPGSLMSVFLGSTIAAGPPPIPGPGNPLLASLLGIVTVGSPQKTGAKASLLGVITVTKQELEI